MNQWIEADDFAVTEALRLDAVRFWNFERAGTFTGTVLWQIYANADGETPGTLIASGTSSNVSHTATGASTFGFLEFANEFPLAPLRLSPGTYWLALHNGPLENAAPFSCFWGNSSRAGTRPSYNKVSPYTGPWISNAFPGFPSELAFALSGVSAPKITSCIATSGIPRITFSTTSGEHYRVVYKNNLAEAQWIVLPGAELIDGTGGNVEVGDLDPNVRNVVRRFYRVEML